jgi:hypothetical protein
MSNNPSVADFDPNNPNHLQGVWMIYTGSWRGIHFTAKRPTALNRVSGAHSAKLYEYVPGQGWVLRVFKGDPSHPDVCDLCGGPVKDTLQFDWHPAYHWRRQNGKIVTPPEMVYVCAFCAPSVQHR